MTATERVKSYLKKQYEPVTAKAISKDTEIPLATVNARLSEWKKAGMVEAFDTNGISKSFLWSAPEAVQKGETLQELESLKPASEPASVTPEPKPAAPEPQTITASPDDLRLSTAHIITAECDAIKAMLLAKNTAYGNSALDPLRIFSKSDTIEQLNIRIDDKLSRLKRGKAAGEDTELDLIGYLILKRVATTWLGGTK